jgi:hypothetical protein
MDKALLDTVRKLVRCGKVIEQGLERTLTKADGLGHHVTYVLSDVLSKLVQDVAGAPVVLGNFTSDPQVMKNLVVALHEVLTRIQPEKLTTRDQLARAENAVRKMCVRLRLPSTCEDVFVVLVAEIYEVFRGLDEVLASPVVKKRKNAEILRRCVRHFFRDARASLLCYSFNSLKMAVCLRALGEGCVSVSRKTKEAVYAGLRLLKKQARCIASVNDVHSDNIFTALAMAKRRQR